MQIGDIVKKKCDEMGHPFIGHLAYKDELGIVLKTDKSLEVTSHCVKVFFPTSTRPTIYRISFLELVSESR